MTGQTIIEQAARLLGYTAANGNLQLSARITNRALGIINSIYSDLWRICCEGDFVAAPTLLTEIKLPERALNDVFIYGAAMLMAQSESDGDSQQLYASIYNQKRSGLSRVTVITDVLPRGEDE